MKKELDIIFLLDRSGSMETIKEEAIHGFNKFVEEQKKSDYNTNLCLIQFNQSCFFSHQGSINEIPKLDYENYLPDGLTALLDAIGKTIIVTKERHKKLDPNSKPAKVFFVILTDGLENNSRIYSRKKIFKMISKMEKKFEWEFIYLGANQDAIEESSHFGIRSRKAMTFAADKAGIKNAYESLSTNILSCTDDSEGFKFKECQRKEQERPR